MPNKNMPSEIVKPRPQDAAPVFIHLFNKTTGKVRAVATADMAGPDEIRATTKQVALAGL